MTGIYLRAKNSDGKWDAVEIEDLSDAQVDEIMTQKTPEELIRWIKALCDTIRMAKKVFDDHGIVRA